MDGNSASKDRYVLHNADCLEAMKGMAADSVDAIVTDPPYALTGASGTGGFMGAKWDSELPTVEMWKEALRVAKPGAHLLAFGGTRTYHRLACAIEDAGWEIRDCIMWVYGSGFPKSMDVSKAIDKMKGAERKVVGTKMGLPGYSLAPSKGESIYKGGFAEGGVPEKECAITAPATPEAAAWSGWGTALKPACEPIVIARKPLEGTVAANVLKYGTGAINIDGCRVPTKDKLGGGVKAGTAQAGWDRPFMHDPEKQAAFGERKKANVEKSEALGRFPANLIHDGSEEVLALFPDSKGQCGAVRGTEPSEITNGIYGKYNARLAAEPRGDTGSAARFFYCAKASRSERGEGNYHMTVKPLALMRYLIKMVTREGATVLDPFMGSGSTGVAALELGRKFVGIEKEKGFYEIAGKRVGDAAKADKSGGVNGTAQMEFAF